jgi:hypothetical protein
MFVPEMKPVERVRDGWRLWLVRRLPEMLASGRLDQAIGAVKDVTVSRRDEAIAKEYLLLSLILNVGYVADGVVGVVQILKQLWSPPRAYGYQSQRERVIFIHRSAA